MRISLLLFLRAAHWRAHLFSRAHLSLRAARALFSSARASKKKNKTKQTIWRKTTIKQLSHSAPRASSSAACILFLAQRRRRAAKKRQRKAAAAAWPGWRVRRNTTASPLSNGGIACTVSYQSASPSFTIILVAITSSSPGMYQFLLQAASKKAPGNGGSKQLHIRLVDSSVQF